ncbi:MAG: glycosyltransferase, partial [Flammeovirgaceae bacterium]
MGVFHGAYSRDELPDKVAAIGGHVMGIFSIWPETYCHVLSEAWACGMPVIGSNLGALKERINIHGGGWVVDISKPKSAYNKICAIRGNSADYERKTKSANL